ncbi:protein FAM180A [Danio aesculapii]|uniref:protein FAM180A n=1 Tax=Danio aesculapii TaxID=1142201 RepID=UPI0024BF30AE|nr:protein FAM180A [Danio aesculapii]
MSVVWIVCVCWLMCQMSITASQHWRRALYPSAFRVKRGTPALINPSFQKTVEDAGLLYEVLLSGGFMDAVRGTLHVPDAELSSMRRLQVLEVLCEDVLPRSLSEILRVSAGLEQRHGTLRLEDFERTVLTLVFTAQQIQQKHTDTQREIWSNTLIRLYQAVKADLQHAHS